MESAKQIILKALFDVKYNTKGELAEQCEKVFEKIREGRIKITELPEKQG